MALKKIPLKKLDDGIPNSVLRCFDFQSTMLHLFYTTQSFKGKWRPCRNVKTATTWEAKQLFQLASNPGCLTLTTFQVVCLREVFPHGPGFVLVFDYMLSDLAKVIRNSEHPLTEASPLSLYLSDLCVKHSDFQAQVKTYMIQLLKGVAYLHSHSIMHRVGIFCGS